MHIRLHGISFFFTRVVTSLILYTITPKILILSQRKLQIELSAVKGKFTSRTQTSLTLLNNVLELQVLAKLVNGETNPEVGDLLRNVANFMLTFAVCVVLYGDMIGWYGNALLTDPTIHVIQCYYVY